MPRERSIRLFMVTPVVCLLSVLALYAPVRSQDQEGSMMDLPAFAPAHVVELGGGNIESLAFSQSGASLYVALLKFTCATGNHKVIESEAFESRVVEVDVATGRVVRTLLSVPGHLGCLRVMPDGKSLLACGFRRERLLIDIESGGITRRYAVPDPSAEAGMKEKADLVGYDCRTIYTVGLDDDQAKTCIFATDLETGKTQRVVETGGCRCSLSGTAWRTEVSLIPGIPPRLLEFSCLQRGMGPPERLLVRDLAQGGAVVQAIEVKAGLLGYPVFSSDGHKVFVPDKAYPGKIRVWDLETGLELAGFGNTPDGYEPQWVGAYGAGREYVYMPFYRNIPGREGMDSKWSVILVGSANEHKWLAQLTYIEGTWPRIEHMLAASPDGRTVAAMCVGASETPATRRPPALMLWDLAAVER